MQYYYYLLASLPTLSLDNPPPFSMDDYRQRCKDHLTKNDIKALDNLLEATSSSTNNDFIKQWRSTETQLRNAIVRSRASKANLDPDKHLKDQNGSDSSIEKAVADAMSASNPLEREKALDKFRWDKAEDLAGYDPFTTKALLAYTLKLMLAQRWADMTNDKGSSKLDDSINPKPDNKEEE